MGSLRARVLVVATMLAACSSPTGEEEECYLPLERYCSGHSCPSYEQGLVELRQFGTGFCLVAEAGRCGGLRFTRWGGGFGNTTLYFDESGAVVAVYATTDAGNARSACPFWKHYGRRVSCQPALQEDYCRR
jgi:hypothetical protein